MRAILEEAGELAIFILMALCLMINYTNVLLSVTSG